MQLIRRMHQRIYHCEDSEAFLTQISNQFSKPFSCYIGIVVQQNIRDYLETGYLRTFSGWTQVAISFCQGNIQIVYVCLAF